VLCTCLKILLLNSRFFGLHLPIFRALRLAGLCLLTSEKHNKPCSSFLQCLCIKTLLLTKLYVHVQHISWEKTALHTFSLFSFLPASLLSSSLSFPFCLNPMNAKTQQHLLILKHKRREYHPGEKSSWKKTLLPPKQSYWRAARLEQVSLKKQSPCLPHCPNAHAGNIARHLHFYSLM